MGFDPVAFEETRANARRELLAARTPDGYWEGELSSSALSTATAVFALALYSGTQPDRDTNPLVLNGLDWLAANQNRDGGWGDTIKSLSNISTTALCWAAFAKGAGGRPDHVRAAGGAERWLAAHAGGIDPGHLIPAIIARYGKDRTFSVPILTMCALAGRLGDGREAWKRIPQLPFELAAFPQRWFKWLRLPVVSYALPALIAIGLVRHRRCPTRNPALLAARGMACSRALRLLKNIQPGSGGFLEATPLTSFVVMSLIGAGLRDHAVVSRGIDFLTRSARASGSWPIDTNLATWVTTLAVNALAADPQFDQVLPDPDRTKIRDWLLAQQYKSEHPYTLADPGCWAWTHLSGGVPDADDTAGAVLALQHLGPTDEPSGQSALAGLNWLAGLQNRDGGIPTFCRGWGKLPFDRSSPDLTAHFIRAAHASIETGRKPPLRISAACVRAMQYLQDEQRPDGSWLPLWFGNQFAPDDGNPTYGTTRVLLAGNREIGSSRRLPWAGAQRRGVAWLLQAQNADGGWGGGPETPSSIEETALAVEALSHHVSGSDRAHLARGVDWLIERTERGRRFEPSPIGFYFARLWYYEKLYPLIFTVAALNAVKVNISAIGLADPAPSSSVQSASAAAAVDPAGPA